MHTRPWLLVVVEIEVWVARAHATRVKPDHAAVAKEHILTPAVMVGAIACTDREKVFMIRLIGEHGDPRRVNGFERAVVPRGVPVTDVVRVIPTQHASISCGLRPAYLLDLLEACQLFESVGRSAIARAIEDREVIEHSRVMKNDSEHPSVRIGPVCWRIRQGSM